jgi:predicted outer membrane protein
MKNATPRLRAVALSLLIALGAPFCATTGGKPDDSLIAAGELMTDPFTDLMIRNMENPPANRLHGLLTSISEKASRGDKAGMLADIEAAEVLIRSTTDPEDKVFFALLQLTFDAVRRMMGN